MKMDKEVRRSFERKNLERAAKKAAVVGLTTLVLSTSGIQANAASRYDNSNYRGIGYISKVEEVSELGNGGYISTGAGDYGGVSYGIYQFSTTTGSARDFINWTKKNDQEVYKYFKAEGNPRPSTAAFNRAWKKAYKELGTKFEKSQYNFASEYLIKPAYNRVKKRFGLDLKKSRAREEYLISTAVQFGPGGICNLFKEVENRGIKLDDNMDDSELLSIMCNHKRDTVAYHFRSSSAAVKAAARQRFIREKKELLKISKEESGKTLDEMKETKTSTTKVSSSKETNDTSTEEFDDVIAVDDKDIEKDYDKVEKELDEIKDTISNETQDNTESKDEEDKSTTEDEDTSKEETTDEETSKDESAKEDKSEEDNTESEDKEADTKEETKDEDKQETTTENGSSLDNTLFVGDSHMKGAESTIKNNYDNSQVKATVGASAYVYLHDTKFFGEKLINSLPEDSDDIHQVVVSLGVNNITGATNESDVIKVLEKLQAKYPGKPIRFMLVNHVGNKYTEASVSKTNKLIDNLNKTISNYAKEHENVSVIDASEGLETDGKLTSTNDGLHVNNNKKLLNNIEKGVEEKQDKTTLEEAPDQVKTTDEFDSIVDKDTTKDIEEPDKATEEDNDKQESSKEDKQESTEKETTKEDKSEEKDNVEKEDKESDTKEESKDEDKSTESEKESSKEETTTEDNTVEEDNDKEETSKDESAKEDKAEEEKDYDTKEESSVKEDKQESTSEETKDNTEKESTKEDKVEEKDNNDKQESTEKETTDEDKEVDTKEEVTDKETSKEETTKEDKTEDKSEEKAVEEKQESSKEETKDNTVKENKSTESEKESTKEDKVEEKDNAVKETKEETPVKENTTEKESSKDESVKENKVEEKAVEQKQESSKEKEQPVQEEKTTEKQETTTEDNSKQEDNSTEQSSDTLNELQSRLSNNLFGKLMS